MISPEFVESRGFFQESLAFISLVVGADLCHSGEDSSSCSGENKFS